MAAIKRRKNKYKPKAENIAKLKAYLRLDNNSKKNG